MFAIFVSENKTVRFLEKFANAKGKKFEKRAEKTSRKKAMSEEESLDFFAEFPEFQVIAKARQDVQPDGKGRAKKAKH